MASIKKVTSHLEAAERHIDALQAGDTSPDVMSALTALHAAVLELSGIVRSDRV